MFAIQVAEPYPADWDGCLTRANEEKANANDIHPELVQILGNIEVYDTVFGGIQTGGIAVRWQFIRFLIRMISVENRFICSVHMEQEGLED